MAINKKHQQILKNLPGAKVMKSNDPNSPLGNLTKQTIKKVDQSIADITPSKEQ